MAMKTDQRLIAAAASLLDSGGEAAVTLRAVALAVGVSHNAPYKHFKDRSGLLAAVAIQDFTMLTAAFAAARQMRVKPLSKLKRALTVFVSYSQRFPARYRLLFSDPDIAAHGGELEAAALRTFAEFAAIVQGCQDENDLPNMSNPELTSLIYASVHGLIDLQAGGRMRQEKGLASVEGGVDLLLRLLSRAATPSLAE
jgi:AcrR family transcriptional regulator